MLRPSGRRSGLDEPVTDAAAVESLMHVELVELEFVGILAAVVGEKPASWSSMRARSSPAPLSVTNRCSAARA